MMDKCGITKKYGMQEVIVIYKYNVEELNSYQFKVTMVRLYDGGWKRTEQTITWDFLLQFRQFNLQF